jgi:hypothetical protein
MGEREKEREKEKGSGKFARTSTGLFAFFFAFKIIWAVSASGVVKGFALAGIPIKEIVLSWINAILF